MATAGNGTHAVDGGAFPVTTVLGAERGVADYAGRTHVGVVRSDNQDAWWTGGDGRLFVVADGMGGLRHGRWASDQLVREVAGVSLASDVHHMCSALEAAVRRGNWTIYTQARHLGARIGTTLVAMAMIGPQALICWCGDSRLYISRSGRLYQLTRDHVTQLDNGREALSRAVGVESQVRPEFKQITVQKGDRLLLCTDGVHHELSDEDLAILLHAGDCSQAAMAIERQVLARGARDNLTMIVVDI
ncbi:MAG: serine/threonine-protein phosphatase [Gammaproteobacteria bacterium]|nr:MAG: serine/threonine-protein phosphatase [Gammaproteobacteria bacterium]